MGSSIQSLSSVQTPSAGDSLAISSLGLGADARVTLANLAAWLATNGIAATTFEGLLDAVTAPIASTNTSVANAIATLSAALAAKAAQTDLATLTTTVGTKAAASDLTATNANVTALTNSLSGKQATLVSATNIKTVNGTSLLGSGDLAIAAGAPLGPYATASALQTAKPAASNQGASALVGSAVPYAQYVSNGSAWVAVITDPGSQSTITTGGTVAVTQLAHANKIFKINTSSAVTLAFSNAATGGYTGDAGFTFLNEGTGVVTVTGVYTGTSNASYTVGQNQSVYVQYAPDTDVCTNQNAVGAGVVPLTVTAMQVPSGAPGTIVLTMSRAVYGGALPAASTFAPLVAGTADAVTAVTLTDSTHLTLTLTTAVTNGQAVTLAYTEGAVRLRSLDTDTPLQSFTAATVTNNVAASGSLAYVSMATRSANVDLTALAPLDWAYQQPSNGNAFYYKASGSGTQAYNAPSGCQLNANAWTGGLTVSFTDGNGGTSQTNDNNVLQLSHSTAGTFYGEYSRTCAAGVPITVECSGIGSYNDGTGTTISASLDDASAGPTTPVTLAANNTQQSFKYHVTPATTTTLRIRVTSTNASGTSQIFAGLWIVTSGTN